jgi:NADPH2:quinone reductase
VLVHAAAGGVGTLLIQLACLQGAEVIAKVGSDHKLNLVKELGAMHAVNYKITDYAAFLADKCGKIDVSFNPVGGSTFKKDMSLLDAGGRMVIFGGSELGQGKFGIFSKLNFVRKMGLIIPVGLMMSSRNILGVNMLRIADNKPDLIKTCLNGMMELYRGGKIKPVPGEEFSASELSRAHELLESGRSIGKICVTWNK